MIAGFVGDTKDKGIVGQPGVRHIANVDESLGDVLMSERRLGNAHVFTLSKLRTGIQHLCFGITPHPIFPGFHDDGNSFHL